MDNQGRLSSLTADYHALRSVVPNGSDKGWIASTRGNKDMSESTITQPVYEPQEPQAPVSKKFVYAGVAAGAVALALGGAALGISTSQPHVSPAQAQAYADGTARAPPRHKQ